MNQCNFVGYVTKDPKCSVSKDGKEYSNFTLAVSRNYSEGTDWIKCIVFGQTCSKYIKPFIHKGSLVEVSGVLQTDSYEKDGQTIPTFIIRVEKIKVLNTKRNTDIETEVETDDNEQQVFDPIDDSQDLPF